MNPTPDNASAIGAPLQVGPAGTTALGLPHVKEIQDMRHPRMRVWLFWLAAFYAAWLTVNFELGLWHQTRDHWPIALAMTLGSYVAGATPMGGGTVGFPVLVLLFHTPAALGRNFGLLIQSIGMTSASIFILCRKTPVESRMLGFSVAGAVLGLLAGTFYVSALLSDASQKLVFACLWFSFGALTLLKNKELCASEHLPTIPRREAAVLGLGVGVAGGITTAVTGVGIDMLLYTVLVLLYRMDLKAAVPTSVIAMAITSVLGAALHIAIGDLGQEVFHAWLAASPVVILGAPLGAFLVSRISRLKTLYFVAVLCVLQFAWTIREVRPSVGQLVFVTANLLVATAGFVALYRLGRRRRTREPAR